MIRSENARPSGWVFVDMQGRDLGGYVDDAKAAIAEELELPAGYSLGWSGQYEYLRARGRSASSWWCRSRSRIIVLLLYLNFRNARDVGLILFSLPFALVGGVWLLYFLDYDLSIAAAVGFIALAGVAAETGVVMVMYLEHAWADRRARGGGGPRADARRAARGDRRRRPAAPATEAHDGHHDHRRPAAHHVGQGHGLRGDAADRGPDGGRHGVRHGADARHHSVALPAR